MDPLGLFPEEREPKKNLPLWFSINFVWDMQFLFLSSLFRLIQSIVSKFLILWELCNLTQEKVDAFLNSYSLYAMEANGTEKKEEEKLAQKLVDYYSVLNKLCALGDISRMYIPPHILPTNLGISANQQEFEVLLCKDLQLGPYKRALDIGCGRGLVARHVTEVSQAKVYGMNIDETQLREARAQKSLNCEFFLYDMNHPPFPFATNLFDAIYEIQVFSLAANLDTTLQEVFRLLKPGGRFAALEWMQLDKFDSTNPDHLELLRKIKPLIGAIHTPTVSEWENALKRAGFRILKSKNISLNGHQYLLIQHIDGYFRRFTAWIHQMVRCNLVPSYLSQLFSRYIQDGDAFIKADQMGLFTTSYYFVAEKPI